MHPNVAEFLRVRAQARALGDRGLEDAMNADLARIGYIDPGTVERIETASHETTAVRAPERAVPQRGGRPKLPRCAHGKTPGHCAKCSAAQQ